MLPLRSVFSSLYPHTAVPQKGARRGLSSWIAAGLGTIDTVTVAPSVRALGLRKRAEMNTSGSQESASPSQLIDARIKELGDWRGDMLARLRALVKEADPDTVEEWKWRGVPVWYHDGMVCTGETYKDHVKMTFAKGAALKDPSGLFNSGLDGNTRRAIDFHEGDGIDEQAIKALVAAAVALNVS